ncbi:MAG: hypothetical protein R2911_20785 [Caldilineaceae bacterium]
MLSRCNGKPAAVLVNIFDEDELDGLILAYSPKFRACCKLPEPKFSRRVAFRMMNSGGAIDAEYDDEEIDN